MKELNGVIRGQASERCPTIEVKPDLIRAEHLAPLHKDEHAMYWRVERHVEHDGGVRRLAAYLGGISAVLSDASDGTIRAPRGDVLEFKQFVRELPGWAGTNVRTITESWDAEGGSSDYIELDRRQLACVLRVAVDHLAVAECRPAAFQSAELAGRLELLTAQVDRQERLLGAYAAELLRPQQVTTPPRPREKLASQVVDVVALTAATAGVATPLAAELFGKRVAEEVAITAIEVGFGGGLFIVMRRVFELFK